MGLYFARFFASEAAKCPNKFKSESEYAKFSFDESGIVYLHNPYEQIYLI